MKIRKYLKPASEILCGVLTVLLVCLCVYILICGARGKAATIGGKCVMRVATGSMEPSLQVGDYIFVEKTDPDKLNAGDIISFYSSDPEILGEINTHRIVRRAEDGFVTKGDANPIEDRYHAKDTEIIGVYCGKIRFLRWLNSFASFRKLALLLVVLTTLGIAAYEVVTIMRISRESHEEAAREAKEKAMREAVEREKKRLAQENFTVSEVTQRESGNDHEAEDVHGDRG